MHIDITDISVASDGTASLTFSKADRSSGGGGEADPDTPVTPSGSVLLYESLISVVERVAMIISGVAME